MSPSLTIPQDYHLHSKYSFDGQASIFEMCQSAIRSGIPEIGFSEHLDFQRDDPSSGFYQPDLWWKEIESSRNALTGRLTIKAGIELGEPHKFSKEIMPILSRYPYDYSIGSLHYVGENFLFDDEYLHRHSADEVLGSYFEELEEMTRTADFDILGHLDIPVRTASQYWTSYDPGRYEHSIRSVLQNCIRRNIALDVNTAGLRKAAHNLMPDGRILDWYAEMGGRRVTLGSDAHSADQVGKDLDIALEAIQAAGIDQLTCFEKRGFKFLPI